AVPIISGGRLRSRRRADQRDGCFVCSVTDELTSALPTGNAGWRGDRQARYRGGRLASWNHDRTPAIRGRWSGGGWRARGVASGVPEAAPQRVSTQSFGL